MTYRILFFVGLVTFMMGAQNVRAADFTEQPVSVAIPNGTLSGTLMLPAGSGPFPVAIIVAGSGPTDRNGDSPLGLKTNAYQKLAVGLAQRGIATLRYDKRGIGASTVHEDESAMTLGDFVNDADALVTWCAHDSKLKGISIIGHSEGSLIGMLVAERDPQVRAFVSIAGAGRNLAAIIDEQVRSSPDTPLDLIVEVERVNASLLAGQTVSDVNPALSALFRPSVQPFLISEYRYDPPQELAKLTIPVLLVRGTTDIQVSSKDMQLLAAADPKARVVEIPGMNHALVDAPADRAGNIATYSQPDLPLSAALVPAIANFLTASVSP